MDIKAYGETAKAIGFSATYEDFKFRKDKLREWQEVYFNLLSLKNTYSAFYEVDIHDYRVAEGKYSVRYYIIAKKAYAKSVREWLEDYFEKFNEWEEDVALISALDITDTKGNELEGIYSVYEG